jgi:hypothetical protein
MSKGTATLSRRAVCAHLHAAGPDHDVLRRLSAAASAATATSSAVSAATSAAAAASAVPASAAAAAFTPSRVVLFESLSEACALGRRGGLLAIGGCGGLGQVTVKIAVHLK